MEEKFRKEDLVVLKYASNSCYTQVITAEEAEQQTENLIIDTVNGTWTFDRETFSIGERGIRWHGSRKKRYGIIGVYDRTNIRHLDLMVIDGKEATEADRSLVDY